MRATKAAAAAIAGTLILGGCASAPRMQANCAEPNYGAAVAGTVVGGLIGAQVGAGLGRDIAIALGAGTGGVAGSRVNCR